MPPWPHNDAAEGIKHAETPWRREYVSNGRLVVMHSGGFSPTHPLGTVIEAARRMRDDEGLGFLFIGKAPLSGRSTRRSRARPRNIRSRPFLPLETLRYFCDEVEAVLRNRSGSVAP